MVLVAPGQPEHVRVKEKEENHEDCEEVHVKHEEDACVIEVPSRVDHAAVSVGAADDRNDCGEDEEQGRVVIGEARE